MNFITSAQRLQLLANGAAQRNAIDNDTEALDFHPVVSNSGTAVVELPQASPQGEAPGRRRVTASRPTRRPPGCSSSSTPRTKTSPSASAT